VKRWI